MIPSTLRRETIGLFSGSTYLLSNELPVLH